MARKLIGPQGKEWTVAVTRAGDRSREPGGGIPGVVTHITFTNNGERRVATTATEAAPAEALANRERLALLGRASRS